MLFSRQPAFLSALALALAVFSWGVQSQSAGGGTVSMAEVQAFIEEKVGDGFPVDEIISSGLELGYRPELLATALMNLSLEPAVIALALAAEGVTRVDAAKAVISVAGPLSSTPVMEALLIGASAEEVQTLTEQIAELVTQLNTTPAQESVPAEQEVVATIEPTPEPALPTPDPVSEPPPVVVIVVEPTPPIMGGGGGSTLN
jgi:hypothetical protein